jgi:hypothetical protein
MTTQAADYTYTVSRSGACTSGCTGTLTTTGTITVNNLGPLSSSNITQWSLTINSPGLSPTTLTPANSSLTYNSADLYATATEFYLATAPVSGSHEEFGIKVSASNTEWIVSDEEMGGAPYEYFGNFTATGSESSFLPIPEGPGNKVPIGVRQGGGNGEDKPPVVYIPPPPPVTPPTAPPVVTPPIEPPVTPPTAPPVVTPPTEPPVTPPVVTPPTPIGSGKDCATILATNPSSPSGYYSIDPDGDGNIATLVVYCDQLTDGGGWTIINYQLAPTWKTYFTSWFPVDGNTMAVPDTSDNASRTLTKWFSLATSTTAFRRSELCQTVTSSSNQGEAYAATGNFYGCTWYNRNCDARCSTCADNYGQQTMGTCSHFEIGGPSAWDAIYNAYSGSCGGDWWNRAPSLGLTNRYCLAYKNPPVTPPVPEIPTISATQLEAGGQHTCLVTRTHTVQCWGANDKGQLGETTPANPATAVTINNLSGITAVSASTDYTCALTTEGTVKCWGSNGYGALKPINHPTYFRVPPTDIPGVTNVTAIATGGGHVCVLHNTGGVSCWGKSYQSPGTTRATPTLVEGLSSGVTAITAGEGHTCALLTTGMVKCWGYNTYGQVGDGTAGAGYHKYAPVEVQGLREVIAIGAGRWHSCAVMTGGSVKCWGRGDSYQLGNGNTTSSRTPVEVNGLNNDALTVVAGTDHSCALLKTGGVKCWGSNFTGQVTETNVALWKSATAIDVTGLTAPVVAVTATDNTGIGDATCALTASGTIQCWGAYYTVIPLSSTSRNIIGQKPVEIVLAGTESSIPVTSTSSSLPTTTVAAPVAVVTQFVPGVSACASNTTQLDASCNAQGQVFSGKLEVSASTNVSQIEVKGTIENHGWISNTTIQPGGAINGGVLTGYITNAGTLSDFEFVGASITGGTLAGNIINNSRVGGWFKDVTLAPGTKITGGTLKGQIQGDCKTPAVLEKVRVADGSSLSCVILGKEVKLGKNVKQQEVKMVE